MSFFEDVYEAVKKVPKGYVSTYGHIAAYLGNPRASRAVGYALHANPYEGIVPCHRIVNRFGGLSPTFVFGGADVQKRMLQDEGVVVSDDYIVDLKKYLWELI